MIPAELCTQESFNALCRSDLNSFTAKAFSILEPGRAFEYNWHIGCIAEHLQALWEGEIQDLIINEPPRCLKSVEVAQIFPSWGLGHDPSHQFINASYAHSLAERNVMKTRQIIQSDWYRQLFNTSLSVDMNKKDHFTTDKNGQYKGTGIGGTITGFGADTLIIDDPINPKEAVSDTIRLSAIDEIRSTLFSRFNDYKKRKMVMIMQRLHDGDPTGELVKDGGYYLLCLPAYASKKIMIELRGHKWGMEEGEYLTPRLDKAALDKLRIDLGEYHFAGQYLQSPVPIGGGTFKPEWVQFYGEGGVKPKSMNIVILCDPAGGEELNKKKKKLSDWTAFMVVGLAPDNNYYLLDAIRDRLNPTERVDTLFMLHRKWNELGGKPPKVGYEKYGMMADTHYIREKQRLDSYYFPLIEVGGNVMKEERISRLVPDMQHGRWYFPQTLFYVDGEGRKFDLVQEMLVSEMPTFPKARFDDMLDALSRVYDAELSLVFPKQQIGMVEKARRASLVTVDSWENW